MLSKIDNRFEKLRRRCIEFIFQGREYTVTSTNCICHQVLSIARTWSASPVWIWKTNRIVGRFTKSIRINEPRWGYRNLIGVSLIMSGQTDFQFRYSFDVMIRIVIFYVIAVCSTLFFFFFFLRIYRFLAKQRSEIFIALNGKHSCVLPIESTEESKMAIIFKWMERREM